MIFSSFWELLTLSQINEGRGRPQASAVKVMSLILVQHRYFTQEYPKHICLRLSSSSFVFVCVWLTSLHFLLLFEINQYLRLPCMSDPVPVNA